MRGLRGPALIPKCQAICQHIKSYDVVCLLDTHLDEDTECRLRKFWPGKIFFSHNSASTRTGGIALLFRNTKTVLVGNVRRDPLGRFIFAEFNTGNSQIIMAGVYAPAGNASIRKSFCSRIQRKLLNFKRRGDMVILLGDFNCVECHVIRSHA